MSAVGAPGRGAHPLIARLRQHAVPPQPPDNFSQSGFRVHPPKPPSSSLLPSAAPRDHIYLDDGEGRGRGRGQLVPSRGRAWSEPSAHVNGQRPSRQFRVGC